ncbi:MAG: hypothetical protein A2X87_07415 [Deltaproteobacteria bacterium GWC2_42_51]|nr:MAG: hypothetical protein A2056_03355 [Deltaproteobacteria bacterium GWA2_42_85]OGP28870.1 MAG: hypothetical protein A2067_03295 [Deltaproteobacteria bacterium GWB2_42_7]OGP31067.1 MAG: hypothetical protein A2X87_07415 [Deltaproteobacteria bacterium GWC2_42_51]OGP43750.1 MAG: hypothetical protein A2090_08345 [Deltaproteobacteria bacterium GWD2_42_10]OGP46064.1 MAG: hypothetical protein A2022_04295 [Deltaproteobacteria bacterium GWF2_42_12]OGQ23890.1 MAG: hypothetical protein A3D29_02920 [De
MSFRRRPRNVKRREPLIQRMGRRIKFGDILRALKVGISLISIVLIVYGVWHIYNELLASSYLKIKEVKVVGNIKLSRSEALELSGIAVGDNILAIDSGDIKDNIKANPWIADVRVKRNFPDRISIEIQERKPVAFINLDGLYYVDETGIIFKKASLGEDVDLPVITGLTREDIEEQGAASELAIKAVNLLHILAENTALELENLSEINVDRTYGLTLYTMREGTKIEFGGDGFKEKLDILDKIIKSRNGFAGLEFIALNYNRGVVVKLNPSETSATHKIDVKAKNRKNKASTSI